jgi:DNA-binding transcriptional MocR family regulator
MAVKLQIVTVTSVWSPELAPADEPKYLAIVEALLRDVESGQLAPGTRLPTQRELARQLGIAIGTVSRAYAIAEQRGIVRGEVGRGTFIRRDDPSYREAADETSDAELVDLSRGRLVRPLDDPALADTLRLLAQRRDLHQLLDIYQSPNGMGRHRAAGAAWLKRSGLDLGPDRVVITSGAQHGAAMVLASIARAGDLILTEEVTYSGITALARLLQLRVQGLPMDQNGLLPEALEAACRTRSPRALFCMPTLQNPTGRTMTLARRRDIAEIVQRYNLRVLEDDVNGFLPAEPLPPLAALAPDHTFYISGTSKSLAPGLRIGYVAPPAADVQVVSASMQATTWFTAPLMAEIVTEWIESGKADQMTSWKRAETAARHALALNILAPFVPRTGPTSFHLWVPLPEPWRAESFVNQARARGVVVNSPDEFLVGRDPAPHAVRVCLGAGLSRARLEEGLRRLAALLGRPPGLSAMVY